MPFDVKKFRACREGKGLTQTKLSELTGIPQSSLARLESGDRTDIRISTLECLAKGLGCTAPELLASSISGSNVVRRAAKLAKIRSKK